MTMTFSEITSQEIHRVNAWTTITTNDVMNDQTSKRNPATGKWEPVAVPFQPDHVNFAWTWGQDTGWRLTSCVVVGYRVKSDNTLGVQRRSVALVQRGAWSPDAPPELVELADKLSPTTSITTDE